MKKLNQTEYEAMINSDKLSLVKYKAVWCGPCSVLGPILEDVVNEFPEINAGEIDIDEHTDIAVSNGVRGVPTVIFYKNGQVVDRVAGLQSNTLYQAKIKALS